MQLYVELTPAGGVLRPEPGIYAGPVVLNRAITIDGQGKVTIDAEGDDTVLTIKTDNCIIRGLHLTGSGESYNDIDSAITIEGDNNLIENNTIDEVLFGINLSSANENIIRKNRITSRENEISLRGDGLRLWNSHDNFFVENNITRARDVFIINSNANTFLANQISHSRVGLQFVFSPENKIINNTIAHNSTGILVLYSNDLLIEGNTITHLRSFSGSALAFKESNGVVAQNNSILHCATGVSANSPVHPENRLSLFNNRFAYNDVALYFYGEKGGHIIHKNHFDNNLIDVQVSSPTTALHNDWKGNFWDTYQGFDQNKDGFGDTAFELYSYSDRIWRDRPMTQFFRGSALFETIDFAERLSSFSAPQMILRDPQPQMP
ncbi:MAG: nitrous oxide reductase family maturation protein NosD [Pseudomonadota bacterium]